MEKKDLSQSERSPKATEPEGIFVEAEDETDAEIVSKKTAETLHISDRETTDKSKNTSGEGKASQNKGETEGIQMDVSAFEEGDPAEAVAFAPEDDSSTPDIVSKDDSLAFGDLSAEPTAPDPNEAKVIRKKVIRHAKGGIIKGFSAAMIYLILIVCAGILSAYIIISVANDVFAFTKDDSLYEITISDPDMSLKELADYLHEEGIIRYPFIFRLYVGLKDDGKINLKEGTFSISPSYNYDKILNNLNPTPAREEITITFSEGLTVDDIIDIFVENGIGTKAGFIDAIENYDFDYWFLEDLETSEDRYYRLEGYLYPDTYRFFTDSSEVTVLKKLLDNFKRKVPDTYAARCEELGLTLDEAVILASMIESECARINDFEYVSAVFHNRLKSASFAGLLGSDATIQYILRHTTGERKSVLTDEDLKIEDPYNSRLYAGLPPGPICNPSLNALMAAVYPNTECGYYYFVAQSNGYNLYAKTYQQHLKNIEAVKNGA